MNEIKLHLQLTNPARHLGIIYHVKNFKINGRVLLVYTGEGEEELLTTAIYLHDDSKIIKVIENEGVEEVIWPPPSPPLPFLKEV